MSPNSTSTSPPRPPSTSPDHCAKNNPTLGHVSKDIPKLIYFLPQSSRALSARASRFLQQAAFTNLLLTLTLEPRQSSTTSFNIPSDGLLIIECRRCPLPGGQENRRGFVRCNLRGDKPFEQSTSGNQICTFMEAQGRTSFSQRELQTGRSTSLRKICRNLERVMLHNCEMSIEHIKFLLAAVSISTILWEVKY